MWYEPNWFSPALQMWRCTGLSPDTVATWFFFFDHHWWGHCGEAFFSLLLLLLLLLLWALFWWHPYAKPDVLLHRVHFSCVRYEKWPFSVLISVLSVSSTSFVSYVIHANIELSRFGASDSMLLLFLLLLWLFLLLYFVSHFTISGEKAWTWLFGLPRVRFCLENLFANELKVSTWMLQSIYENRKYECSWRLLNLRSIPRLEMNCNSHEYKCPHEYFTFSSNCIYKWCSCVD